MGALFENCAVLVTGAASGIGRETAVKFATEGAWVLVTDISIDQGKETLQQLSANGGSGEFMHVDVENLDDLRRAVDYVVDHRGRLDVMVNNVGIPMAIRIENITEDQWDKVIDVNMKGTFFGCKYAIEHMLRLGGGAIVNIASDMGLVAGLPNQPAYITSKGGVVLLTKALAIDYARDNIRVNCVCPCLVATPMIDGFLHTQFETDAERKTAKEQLDAVQPIGRMCEPDEIANAVAFLASPLASGITGVALPVDGGFVAK